MAYPPEIKDLLAEECLTPIVESMGLDAKSFFSILKVRFDINYDIFLQGIIEVYKNGNSDGVRRVLWNANRVYIEGPRSIISINEDLESLMKNKDGIWANCLCQFKESVPPPIWELISNIWPILNYNVKFSFLNFVCLLKRFFENTEVNEIAKNRICKVFNNKFGGEFVDIAVILRSMSSCTEDQAASEYRINQLFANIIILADQESFL